MAEINLDMPSLTRNITLTVHLRRVRWFHIKMRVALFFVLIGTLIGGFGFGVEEDLDG